MAEDNLISAGAGVGGGGWRSDLTGATAFVSPGERQRMLRAESVRKLERLVSLGKMLADDCDKRTGGRSSTLAQAAERFGFPPAVWMRAVVLQGVHEQLVLGGGLGLLGSVVGFGGELVHGPLTLEEGEIVAGIRDVLGNERPMADWWAAWVEGSVVRERVVAAGSPNGKKKKQNRGGA